MLKSSFQHIPGIGGTTERRIWESGVTCWEGFQSTPPGFLGKGRTASMLSHLHESFNAVESRNPHYFGNLLPSGEHWRIFSEFRDSCAYVDIETTGLGSPEDIITTIALYDGSTLRWYVNGENLQDFPGDIMDYQVLVTYNGKSFDVPFINGYFGVSLPHFQLDLRYILHSLGYSGGLKACERNLGLGRSGSMAEVDGFFAVILWNEYRRTGSRKVLETLLAYNIADTVNLECLMVKAYLMKAASLPFSVAAVDPPGPAPNPFIVDEKVIEKLRGRW